MEAFLNAEMRKFMEESGFDEETISKKLRRPSFETKLREWPSEILGKLFSFTYDFWPFYEEYKTVRDEITHPKNRDHAIYAALDAADPHFIRQSIAGALVQFYEARAKPWPYWLVGWNYVGLNANPSWPLESNNLNGFYYSLQNFGFRNLGNSIGFDKRSMVTKKDFDDLCEALGGLEADIEPYDPRFPTRPRLTSRWWDQEYLLNEYRRNETSSRI